jgi:predicted ribosome-associated RNA-binding protein Tma20
LFNDWINKFALIELKNASRQFTWANNEDNLIMALLDRVLISVCWENLFPACSVRTLPRVESDYSPLVVDSGALKILTTKQFRFEKW